MGWVNAEFYDWEQDKMNQAFDFLVELLEPKKLKPPKKNAESGKWHFYIETPDHKRASRRKMY